MAFKLITFISRVPQSTLHDRREIRALAVTVIACQPQDSLIFNDIISRSAGCFQSKRGETSWRYRDISLSKYHETMTVHIFQSITVPELYGFTPDATGATLPADTGPWAAAGDALPLGITMASKSPAIGQQIEANGYALVGNRSASQPGLPITESRP
jgi:hypothetical protein